jgi:hypothetical protein
MSLRLIKKKFGRKRFLIVEKAHSLVDWKTQVNGVIDWLEKNTLFQRVGTEVYFFVSNELQVCSFMLEVIGKPEILDSNTFSLLDVESDHSYQIFCPHDQFEFSPEALLGWAGETKGLIDTLLSKSGQDPLCEFFLIVFNHEKLALQFFKKNDYIQIRP